MPLSTKISIRPDSFKRPVGQRTRHFCESRPDIAPDLMPGASLVHAMIVG